MMPNIWLLFFLLCTVRIFIMRFLKNTNWWDGVNVIRYHFNYMYSVHPINVQFILYTGIKIEMFSDFYEEMMFSKRFYSIHKLYSVHGKACRLSVLQTLILGYRNLGYLPLSKRVETAYTGILWVINNFFCKFVKQWNLRMKKEAKQCKECNFSNKVA